MFHGAELLQIQQLTFEQPEEIFYHSIVQTVSLAAHALSDTLLAEHPLVLLVLILPTLIRVENQACSGRDLCKRLVKHGGYHAESIILQSQSQLKAIYKDNADTIVGNCDTTLFLGGKEKTTLKEMSEILGKETIDSFNTSETRGRELSHGLNYQKLGKQLMSEDEIAVMDGGKCILQLRGVRPFFSEKYDITKHPKYKYLSDFDKKNAFDMEKHLRRRPAIVKPDEVFDYYEVDEADLQEDTE